jgi:hypothetical protein
MKIIEDNKYYNWAIPPFIMAELNNKMYFSAN